MIIQRRHFHCILLLIDFTVIELKKLQEQHLSSNTPLNKKNVFKVAQYQIELICRNILYNGTITAQLSLKQKRRLLIDVEINNLWLLYLLRYMHLLG